MSTLQAEVEYLREREAEAAAIIREGIEIQDALVAVCQRVLRESTQQPISNYGEPYSVALSHETLEAIVDALAKAGAK